jgi:ribosomal protein S18 acetylase RimI-like enzyme
LRVDVTKRDIVEMRIRHAVQGGIHRVVALVGDKIIADGALEFSGDLWHKNDGEIRVIVAREYQRLKLGSLLIDDLFRTARQRGVEKIVAQMAAPQTAARKIFERLGFHVDSVLPDYIRDADGEVQSLVVMSCRLDDLSNELRDLYRSDNWPDG